MARAPPILTAPRDNFPIRILCTPPDFGRRAFAERLTLTCDGGVEGDRWAEHGWLRAKAGAPGPRIQVAIIGKRLLDLTWDGGDDTPYPEDTIASDMDFSEGNLPARTLLHAGSAVLRFSDVYNDGCIKWRIRNGQDAYGWVRVPEHCWLRLRVVFFQILQAGQVCLEDKLRRV